MGGGTVVSQVGVFKKRWNHTVTQVLNHNNHCINNVVHGDVIDYDDDNDINERVDMMRCGRYVNMRPPSFPIDHVHVLPPFPTLPSV